MIAPELPSPRVAQAGVNLVSPAARKAILACFLIAVALRFWNLPGKPLHHDESLHAFFSLPSELSNYHYDPTYHGPFLYHVNALVYVVLGANDWTCRLVPALLGSAMVLLAFPLARLRDGPTAVSFAFLVALSPSFVYFSRFNRNDASIAFFCSLFFLSVFALARGGGNRWIYFACLGLVLHFVSKETAYLFSATLGGYVPLLVFLPRVTGIPRPGGRLSTALRRLGAWAGRRRIALAAAALLFFDIWVLLYTTGLRRPEDAPAFVTAISYWFGQHKTKRLGGPWFYYFPILVFYEFQILLWIGWLVRRRGLSHPADRFCLYWAAASLGLYGWAGEKVPWLVLHPLTPLTFLAATGLGRAATWWMAAGPAPARRIPALVLAAAIAGATTATTIRANFVYPAPDPEDPLQHSELLSFVQTTTGVPGIVREAVAASRAAGALERERQPAGAPARIVVMGEATWPLSWYFRNESVNWKTDDLPGDAAAIVLDDSMSATWKPALESGFREVPFHLRGWWVPEWGKANARTLLLYALTRVPFSTTGYQNCVLWVKK